MDAPSCDFFSLEKSGQHKAIHSLLLDTWQELTEPHEIRDKEIQFFSALYTSEYRENIELEENFFSTLPQILADNNDQLDGLPLLKELTVALQSMQGRRALGIDGLTVKFCKEYLDILGADLLQVFNQCLATGSCLSPAKEL